VKSLKKAISEIEKYGILLVFPNQNKPEPRSLWSVAYPNIKMRWEWDDAGDSRVSDLWHLRAELSASGRVVYAKWYQGRATLFSKAAFVATYRLVNDRAIPAGAPAQRLFEYLEENSPQSTKQIKKDLKLQGGTAFDRAAKELWRRLWIVGYGEVDDGAFPSLAIGATNQLFDELWREGNELSFAAAEKRLKTFFAADALFIKAAYRIWKQNQPPALAIRKKILRYEDLT
jgi:hypothetical protein